ncbi:hypothetical protein GDO81_010333 [Engystomops pustulosus]|uniref:YEATS domain-containing protein n=1 Tax=Engystomops pustulosus TaxID=76066 RepID=A0AAV7BYZ7_ENGPU|nr:hypothetical protein GDO81_010333 [Engystomops pustulosus]KAG8577948.1 hypothetical protein GDO81_010333 [Engystomops pustulosus]
MFKRMAEFGPDSGGRVKGVTIVKPIVYGNVARYFGKKREEDGHTHQWTVYVKPYRNEDMSAYVKKIQFKLHESYGNPLRVVTKPPYEITETGWGEFEIIIKIFFIDPNERPVSILVARMQGNLSDYEIACEGDRLLALGTPTQYGLLLSPGIIKLISVYS